MKSSLAAMKRQMFPAQAGRRVHGLFTLGLGSCIVIFTYVKLKDATVELFCRTI